MTSRGKLLGEGGLSIGQISRELLLGPQILIDLLTMIVVIGKGRVQVGTRQVRVRQQDRFETHPELVMPQNDMRNLDAMPGDPRLAAADARRHLDVLRDDRDGCHTTTHVG